MADDSRSDVDGANLPRGREPSGQEESAEVRARREARRRVIAGGLATAPLLLTLTSRPAFGTGWYGGGGKTGQNCGPSGLLSGNLSQDHGEPKYCEGKTPGYWKTHPDKCSKYFVTGPCNPITSGKWGTCDDYSVPTKFELNEHLNKLKQNYWKNYYEIKAVEDYLDWLHWYPNFDSPPFGTPFAAIFGPGFTQNPTTTMMQALWLDDQPPLPPDGAGGSSPVLAHCAAAYCNAHEFGKNSYGLSPQEVVELVASMLLTDPFGLKDLLETMNERS